VTEGIGLVFDYVDVRDKGATVHRVCEGNQAACRDDGARETYFGDAICASMEKLGHPVVLYDPLW
jgi:hypothetical protein